jgi:hypothetical protein
MPCKTGRRARIEQGKAETKLLRTSSPEPEFICLECGSRQSRSEIHANTIMDENDPWSMATSRIECWDCGAVMPRELARRWNLSYEEAKVVWIEKFRNDRRSKVKNT